MDSGLPWSWRLLSLSGVDLRYGYLLAQADRKLWPWFWFWFADPMEISVFLIFGQILMGRYNFWWYHSKCVCILLVQLFFEICKNEFVLNGGIWYLMGHSHKFLIFELFPPWISDFQCHRSILYTMGFLMVPLFSKLLKMIWYNYIDLSLSMHQTDCAVILLPFFRVRLYCDMTTFCGTTAGFPMSSAFFGSNFIQIGQTWKIDLALHH